MCYEFSYLYFLKSVVNQRSTSNGIHYVSIANPGRFLHIGIEHCKKHNCDDNAINAKYGEIIF